jgi:hypothetical protein
MVALYDTHQTKITECDTEIERALKALSANRPAPETPLPARRHGKGRTSRSSTRVRRCTGSWARISARFTASAHTPFLGWWRSAGTT